MSQDLSLNDVVMPKCYTRALWMFDYKIADLEKPLYEFLKKYCPIAFGRIVYDEDKPNTGRLINDPSHAKKLFSLAELPDVSIDHYIHCSFQELDLFPYSAIPTDDSPLIFLHQIALKDGTLLAFGAHHHLTDGHGFFSLIDRFARWICNKDDPNIRPLLDDRSLLKPAEQIRYEHVEYTTQPPVYSFTTLPEMDVIVKKFSKRTLFEKLNITATQVSFNDVLVAWLTKAISEIRQISDDETVKMGMASDGRTELGLGPDYFGNCNFYVCLQFNMADLRNKTVNALAEQINAEKKQRLSKDYITSALAWVKAATKPIHPGFQAFLGKDVAFTNWSRFPAYTIDFGQGPAKRISLPPARFDGLVLILPTASDQVELYIGLKRDHANELLQRMDG